MTKLVINSTDFHKVSGLSNSTTKRLRASGDLPTIKVGKRKNGRIRDNRPVLFRVTDVAKLLNVAVDAVVSALEDFPQTDGEATK